MLDLFTIFTKGGIVLWCFRETNELFTPSVNALIRSVILQVSVCSYKIKTLKTSYSIYYHFQERSGVNSFTHNNLTLQYKLDNEFELIFVVAFQKILQLSYVDKFLSDIQLEFRDKYKNELSSGIGRSFQTYEFVDEMRQLLSDAEEWGNIYQKQQNEKETFFSVLTKIFLFKVANKPKSQSKCVPLLIRKNQRKRLRQ